MPDEPGQPTPNPAQPGSQPGLQPVQIRLPKNLVKLGVSLLILGAALLFLPYIHVGSAHINLSQAHGLCTSTLGVLVTAFSTHAMNDCQAVSYGWGFTMVAFVGGGLSLALVLVRRAKA